MKARFVRWKRKTWLYIHSRVKARKLSIKTWVASLEIGNFLVAISTTGLMALGVIPMSMPSLIAIALTLLVIGIVGRYLDAIEDDVERLIVYERHLSESIASSVPDYVRDDSLQSPTVGEKGRSNSNTNSGAGNSKV